MSNYSVVETVAQEPVWAVAPVWMVDYSAPLVNEQRTGRRSADGKFLKLHVKLEQPTKVQSASNLAMAELFGVNADEIFAGSR
jgi:hypothetical protein